MSHMISMTYETIQRHSRLRAGGNPEMQIFTLKQQKRKRSFSSLTGIVHWVSGDKVFILATYGEGKDDARSKKPNPDDQGRRNLMIR